MIRFFKLDTIIKLFSRKGRKFYFYISHIVGYFPRDISIFETAFIHKSFTCGSHNAEMLNNERLEYLGDAMLSAIVAQILYKYKPQLQEGVMTKVRAELVSRKQLNKLGNRLNVEQFAKVKNNQSIENTHIPGNIIEAIVAAIYIDGGWKKMYRFVKRNISTLELIENTINQRTLENYKTDLITWGQRNKKEITFDTHYSSDEHDEHYITKILLDDIEISEGMGQNKKTAEQQAAKCAIEILSNTTTNE